MVPRTRTGGRPSLRVPRQHLCPRLRGQHFPRLENRNRLPACEGGEAATPAAGVVTATPAAELAAPVICPGTRCLVQTSTLDNCSIHTGPAGGAGKSTSPCTTYRRTLGTRQLSTLPGWCIWCWGEEICVSRSSFLMCSLCDTCATWNISEICPVAKVSQGREQGNGIFMCFWATAFLEHWSSTLAHHWDCSDFQEEEECPHPEFAALAPQMAQNPVTGLKEPYFPPHTHLPRLLTSSAAILIMLCVVMIFLVSVIIYCGIVSIAMFHTANSVLMTQLFIITVGKQLVSNVQEFVVLKLKTWQQKRHLAGLQDTQIRQEQRHWEEDCELIEFKGQFDEYLEMDPTGHPEVLCEYWRLVAEQTRLLLREAIAYLSVIVNGQALGWGGVGVRSRSREPRGTPRPPQPRYKGFRDAQRNLTLFYWKLLAVRLGFIIAFEHVVFFLGLIAWLVPDVPAALATKIKRERYLAKQALEDDREALLSSCIASLFMFPVSCSMCNADNNPLCAPACHLSMDIWSPTALCSVSSLCDCALGGEVDMKE
ncbi:hypothetical protein EI555_011342 [Monodon monoceros]|uniref:Anoctamin n=1 Tax=Monodon monoceros TaxID=40151 RepID=A0A4U1EM77_MONMO|nr:hypothetical protein EI555_011342 [Monodon monoceros]